MPGSQRNIHKIFSNLNFTNLMLKLRFYTRQKYVFLPYEWVRSIECPVKRKSFNLKNG